MGTLVLKTVPEDRVKGREIIDTGVSMLGLGGDNVHCGACGREIMHEVPVRTIQVNFLYRCAGCGSLNEIPSDA